MALALAVAIAGCGSGGGESTGGETTTARPLTKAQFVKRASAICRKGARELGKLEAIGWKKYNLARSVTDAKRNKVRLGMLPAWETEVRRLRTLSPPRGDEAYIDRMLTAWEEGIEKGREEPASLWGGGDGFAFEKTMEMGIDYGLIDCWLS